ncbi:MAG: MBL fold metallo-hydrolase [Solirubrobacteraceae bacterium]|nr:MBL fold metallo-hydrolase [Solirubrobacteraceae bacterium]
MQDHVDFLGHATALVQLGGTRVLTDPILRDWMLHLRRHGPSPPAEHQAGLDAVLLSHLHHDHLDIPSLKRLDPAVPLVIPRGATPALKKLGPRDIREIAVGETVQIGGLEVTAVPAVHSGRRALGPEADAVGYVVRSPARSVYFAGDTDLHDEMAQLGEIDLALMPVWGWGPSLGPGHLNPERAAAATALIKPRVAVPIHWGTFYPRGMHRWKPEPLRDPPHMYKTVTAKLAPKTEVRILQPGEGTDLG